MKTVKEKANAKINLYLDVLTKRADGFHDIKTVMHSVTFGDDITVSVSPSAKTTVQITVGENKFLPTDSRNLAVRAALLFLEKAKINAAVEIKLEKRIPVAAGLAGGSSDAAAVLRAMNKLYGRLFSVSALNSIGAELGSDVVYCLYGKCALCEGRGEILTKIKTKAKAYVVIAIANEHISTPVAYKSLDSVYSDFNGERLTGGEPHFDRLIASLSEDKLDTDGFFNVFEDAVLPSCPGATAIKRRLAELGARVAMMSGSGPSVFGIFDSLEASKNACLALRAEKYRAYYTRLVE
ncbi:MAG: 4-(cytidine 5'-diphospho)-2-C-methyl-D-erythritol kinase [Clostridia bacterium]|nr:4-(cytidine 5'-diphospho)-2-C-methyl-D-erythritol kinase [Clostridia bacterium]